MIKSQGQGMESQEYKDFEKEQASILTPIEKTFKLRTWEYFAVFHNAEFKNTDDVLEWGAWHGFGGIQVSKHVRSIIISDNYDWVKNKPYFDEVNKKIWIGCVENHNLPNVTVQEVCIMDTKFNDKQFDKIISYGAFEHVVNDAKGLFEMCRILKDDGRVSMTIDFKYGNAKLFNEVDRERIYNKETLIKLIEDSPLMFLENPFNGWWDKGTIDINQIFALAAVLVKKNE